MTEIPKPAAACEWAYDDMNSPDYWETDCGQSFQFNDDGPVGNGFKFCPYCGKPMREFIVGYGDE